MKLFIYWFVLLFCLGVTSLAETSLEEVKQQVKIIKKTNNLRQRELESKLGVSLLLLLLFILK